MAEDKCGYDDSIVEESARGLDFKSDDLLSNEIMNSDDDKDSEDDPSWAFTGCGSAGDKFDADMDASWVTMRMISHFISSTQPDLEEYLLNNMNKYFECNSETVSESKGCDYSNQQYEIYQNYCNLFEKSMVDFTDEYSKAEIVKTLKTASQSAERGVESMGTILLDMLDALSDFKEFHLMYVEKLSESCGGSPLGKK